MTVFTPSVTRGMQTTTGAGHCYIPIRPNPEHDKRWGGLGVAEMSLTAGRDPSSAGLWKRLVVSYKTKAIQNKQTEPQTKTKVTLPPNPVDTSTLKFAHRCEQKLSVTMHTVLH